MGLIIASDRDDERVREPVEFDIENGYKQVNNAVMMRLSRLIVTIQHTKNDW